MNIGNAIRDLRNLRGWSQGELARRVQAHHSRISNVETGKTLPSMRFLAKVAKSLDTSLPALMVLAAETNELDSVEDALKLRLAMERIYDSR